MRPDLSIPTARRLALRHVRVPLALVDDVPAAAPAGADLAAVDLVIEDGRLADIAPAGTVDQALGPDLGQKLVVPGLVDLHTHLDKGHIWPRAANPTGDVPGAVKAVLDDRTAHWNAEDVERRMEFALDCAYAKGTVAIRTHLDSLAPQAAISFPVFERMRARWAGRIDLQVTSLAPVDIFLTEEGREFADRVADAGGQLGCGTRFHSRPQEIMPDGFDEAMGAVFALAEERGLALDLHVDESSDKRARALPRIARIADRRGFKNGILVGHCTSLALQDEADIAATIAACQQAGIDVVSLPPVNLYLQDRKAGRTPRWRGITVLHEMRAAGLRVAIAGDNCRDPFYAYGDHDMIETFTQAVKIGHLDHPVGDWIASAWRLPADIMGLPTRGRIVRGAPADLVVLKARSLSEMLARAQGERVVLRAGRPIETVLPDYDALDDLVGPPSL